MSEQSKLEKVALAVRDGLIARNIYNGADDANGYGPTHTRALSDQTTPVAGKGTGIFLDTYNGGGDYDINGHPNKPGSGRIKNKAMNQYNENKTYQKPDTSGNIGQVTFN